MPRLTRRKQWHSSEHHVRSRVPMSHHRSATHPCHPHRLLLRLRLYRLSHPSRFSIRPLHDAPTIQPTLIILAVAGYGADMTAVLAMPRLTRRKQWHSSRRHVRSRALMSQHQHATPPCPHHRWVWQRHLSTRLHLYRLSRLSLCPIRRHCPSHAVPTIHRTPTSLVIAPTGLVGTALAGMHQ